MTHEIHTASSSCLLLLLANITINRAHKLLLVTSILPTAHGATATNGQGLLIFETHYHTQEPDTR